MRRWSIVGVVAAICIGIGMPVTSMSIGWWLGVKHGCAKHPASAMCRPASVP